jgi:hypothetical protein
VADILDGAPEFQAELAAKRALMAPILRPGTPVPPPYAQQ